MKGGPSKGHTETSVTKDSEPDNNVQLADLHSILKFLITEIKETLQAKIDLLSDKIDRQQDDIHKLHNENKELKNIIANQEKTITELKDKTSLTKVHDQQPTQHVPITTKQRGIKAYNLIFTFENVQCDEDPKMLVEQTLVANFNRSPKIQAVNVINTRGRQQPAETEDCRGQVSAASNNGATPLKIIATFGSIWDCRAIYKERMRLKNHQIYISEDLTWKESHLFYLSRMLKKKQHIHSTWTEEGDTYFKVTADAPPKILQENDPLLLKLKENEQGNEKIHNSEKMCNIQSENEIHSSEVKENSEEEEDLDELIAHAITGAITRAARKKTKKEKNSTK